MIPATSFAGLKVALFGLGISGLATGRSLVEAGARVVAWDDGEAGREAARRAGLPVADLRAEDWSGFSALVLAPGVPLTHPVPHWTVPLAQAAGVEIIGDTEIFCRERRLSGARTKMIAITGTNGKSTTTALTHHLLTSAGVNAAMGGNIGTAVLDLPAFAGDLHYVLEFSSFQIDLTPSLDADVGALLNISADHIDRHGTLQNYAAIKARIFAGLRDGGAAVVGVDDAHSRGVAQALSGPNRVATISAEGPVRDGVYFRDSSLFEVADGVPLNSVSLQGIPSLRGAHNGQNAAAAVAMARSLGVAWEAIEQGLRTFPGLAHRMEEVGRLGRVIFINDSKATNADAAAKALSSFRDIFWIVGGRAKENGLAGLDPWFGNIRRAYLIGEASQPFAAALEGRADFVQAGTLDNAVSLAARDALADENSPEPVVLLSPACASYDQFPNFTVRGDKFREAVSSLRGVTLRGAEAA